jgi:TIR domain
VEKMDAFISHSSRNRDVAGALEKELEANGLGVWLDDSEIELGALLGRELQSSILECRVLVLLWSAPEAESRYVNAEWLMAYTRIALSCRARSTRPRFPSAWRATCSSTCRRPGMRRPVGSLARSATPTAGRPRWRP